MKSKSWFCLVIVVLSLFAVPAYAQTPAQPVVVQQPDLIDRLIGSLSPTLILVAGGIWYFLKGRTNPSDPNSNPATFKTGRPVLDLIAKLALDNFKGNAVMQDIIMAEAQAIKDALDKVGVPEVPIPTSVATNVIPAAPK